MARKTRKRNRSRGCSSRARASLVETSRAEASKGDMHVESAIVHHTEDVCEIQTSDVPDWTRPAHPSVAEAVEANTELLRELLDQFTEYRQSRAAAVPEEHVDRQLDASDTTDGDQHLDRVSELETQVSELQELIGQLRAQNSDLASQLASSCVRETVATSVSGTSDALSWDDRKQLILQQMEDDSFDAEAFVESLSAETEDESINPLEYVRQLHVTLENREAEIACREQEIRELRCLLDQQSETLQSGVAIGAAAIAENIDSDELIQEERKRLHSLQREWEEKLRDEEIKSSLERAKIARERQELAHKQAELEEQVIHHQRESLQQQGGGPRSRRWLAQLGLNES